MPNSVWRIPILLSICLRSRKTHKRLTKETSWLVTIVESPLVTDNAFASRNDDGGWYEVIFVSKSNSKPGNAYEFTELMNDPESHPLLLPKFM